MKWTETHQLQANNLSAMVGERLLFQSVNFSLENGQGLQITGANGCGKTTLLRIISGILPQYAGEVLWQQQSINSYPQPYYQAMVYVGHRSGVRGNLTCLENLQLDDVLNELPEHSVKQPLDQILHRAGLSQHIDTFASQLSAGQQRRLSLSRLLLKSSPLWILDEPLTSLDKAGQQWFISLLEEHLHNGGIAIVTSHQPLSLEPIKSYHLDS